MSHGSALSTRGATFSEVRFRNPSGPWLHFSMKAGEISSQRTTMYVMTQSATSRRAESRFQCHGKAGILRRSHGRPTSKWMAMDAIV